MPKSNADTHPVWAPAHNREERAQETADAWTAYHREREIESTILAFAHAHGIKAHEARRFLARQRASLRWQQEAQAQQQAALSGKAALRCCDTWWPITQMPLRCLVCNKVYLAWR